MGQFAIIIYSNAHYQDPNESYTLSNFETYDDALQKAMAIVEEDIKRLYAPGMSVTDLLALFKLYGEDPVITPELDADNPFLSWYYAENLAREICNPV